MRNKNDKNEQSEFFLLSKYEPFRSFLNDLLQDLKKKKKHFYKEKKNNGRNGFGRGDYDSGGGKV